MFLPDVRDKNLYQTNLAHYLSTSKDSDIFICFDQNILSSVIKNRPDIIHIHWPNYFMIADSKIMTIIKSIRFICGLSILKLFGTKIIWTVHNITGHEIKFKSTELFFNKLLIRLCNKLIIHCPSARTEIEKLYKDAPTVVIPHGNYISQYENTITKSEAREKLKLSLEDTVFLYFGQIRPYKGVIELINTFKKLDNKQVKLLIAGKPLNNDIAIDILISRQSDNRIIDILQFIPDNEVQDYMNASDIVVLPYKDILTSGAAILAMSFGRPIIAPAIGCITDILDEKGGFLYNSINSESSEGLYDTMQNVINGNKENLANMGIHNLKLAEQFDWSKIAEMTYNTYKECLTKQ